MQLLFCEQVLQFHNPCVSSLLHLPSVYHPIQKLCVSIPPSLHPSAGCQSISVMLEAGFPPSVKGIDLFGPLTLPVSID